MKQVVATSWDLTDNDRHLFMRVQQSMPLLADVARSDLLLYAKGPQPGEIIVLAEAQPHTVPSIYLQSQKDKVVTREEEPVVWQVLTHGKHAHRSNEEVRFRGSPTIQEVWPVFNDGRVVAALSVEIGLLERDRQRRKSIVFRRAVSQLRRMVQRGQLEGASNIGALGEHVGPMVVDATGHILYISSIAEGLYRKLGYTHSLLWQPIQELKSDESVFYKALETGACTEQLVQENGQVWIKKAIPLTTETRPRWWNRFVRRLDEIDGVILMINDITGELEKEQELRIKSAMIREIHHRVKNNLQTIAALLRLQARRTNSPAATDIIKQSINRILSIAVVHEFLSQDEATIIDLLEVCQRIVSEATRGILDPEKKIRFVMDGTPIFLPAQQATSCALIINELLQNALEHGFATRNEGTIAIRLEDAGARLTIEVVDDGDGLAPGFDIARDGSLGLQIIQTLVKEDLKGEFALINHDGVHAVVTFPKLPRRPVATPLERSGVAA
ncbi:MAG: sensor histidine kinase [Chloroflexi bacterium]|nr:sensor histidine kinase [Chloroflexota bacterium]